MQNILGIIDTSGNLVVKYGYIAYGTITDISGSLARTIGAHNPFRYKGYYFDKESNMYYCKSRYYVPQWCRWLNADSICLLDLEDLDGMNLFSYCGNNSITFIDENGNFAIFIAIGLIGLFAMVAVEMLSPDISEGVVFDKSSGLKSFEDFIFKPVADTFVMTSLPYFLTFVVLDNIMMSKKHEEAEYKSNAYPSHLEKHQNGQARKRMDKGGEKGDKRRKKKDKWYTIPKYQNNVAKITNSIAKYY